MLDQDVCSRVFDQNLSAVVSTRTFMTARLASSPTQAIAVIALMAVLLLEGCTGPAAVREDGRSAGHQRALLAKYHDWRGTPYALGGTGRRGIDCSAFVAVVMSDVYGTELPRQTSDQINAGRGIGRSSLKPGDLVFFKTGWFGRHVGIYVGDGEFIHAAKSTGVTKSSLDSEYWSRHYWKARRVADT
jgi:lipoprotein Spr/probable lipoprotein NlpC